MSGRHRQPKKMAQKSTTVNKETEKDTANMAQTRTTREALRTWLDNYLEDKEEVSVGTVTSAMMMRWHISYDAAKSLLGRYVLSRQDITYKEVLVITHED